MKIPYIKIYTADLLAKSRHLSAEQIGNAMIGICEQAFENETLYEPKNEAEDEELGRIYWDPIIYNG